MINRSSSGRASSGQVGSQNQVMPAAISSVIGPGGTMTEAWYHFFRILWMKNSSGIPNDVSLASVSQQASNAQTSADAAQTTATDAANAVVAETQRAQNAEAVLQGQITTNNNALNARFGSINTFGATAPAAGAQAGWINVTINGVNYVMPVYNT